MAKKCPCADPPSGEITCADDQLGICGVIDGKLVVGCFEVPSNVKSLIVDSVRQDAIDNWVLSQLTGISRPDSQPILHQERQVLRSGEYVHPETGHSVKFSLPRSEAEPEPKTVPMTRYR